MKTNELQNILTTPVNKPVNKINESSNNISDKIDQFREILKSRVKEEVASSDIKLSCHAMKRLEERNLGFDGHEFLKIKEAITKLKEKGGHDSLVVTDKAAYIIDVDKSTVVTAIDKADMSENVFTKIDSTYFIN